MNKFYDKFTKVSPHSGISLIGAVSCSKIHKTFFFHIAKTGGSSIHKALVDNGYDDNILANRSINSNSKNEYLKEVSENKDDYFKFTFIRNKFEQLVSLYHYNKNGGLLGDISFETFIIDKVQHDKGLYGEWLDQYKLTHYEDGSEVYDCVGRYDKYEEHSKLIMREVGLSEDCVPRVNITNRDRKKHFSEYYNKETEGIVKTKFKKEIEHFEFEL